MTDVELWYFAGGAGCEDCLAMTGYYVGQAPEAPHPNCKCKAYPVDSTGKVEYRNITTETSEFEAESLGIEVDNCGQGEVASVPIPVDTTAFSEGPEELIAEAGVEEPEGVCIELAGGPMPANTYGTMFFTEVITVTEITAEEWLVTEEGDESGEVCIGEAYAAVGGTTDIRDPSLHLTTCGKNPAPHGSGGEDGGDEGRQEQALEDWLR